MDRKDEKKLRFRTYKQVLPLALTMIVPTCSIPDDFVARTDGFRVEFGNQFGERDWRDKVFIFAHELMHCILRHPERRKGRNPLIWNIAADLIVNDMLRHMVRYVPRDALLPEGLEIYEEKTTEELYRDLIRNAKVTQLSINTIKIQIGDFTMTVVFQEDLLEPSSEEKSNTSRVVSQNRLRELMKSIGGAGSRFERELKRAESNVDLATEIRGITTRILFGIEDLTFRRYSPLSRILRRRTGHQLRVPSWCARDKGEVLFAVDTSCSMSEYELGAILDVAMKLKMEGYMVSILPVSTEVHLPPLEVEDATSTLKLSSMGGTNMVKLFEWVAKQDRTFELLILATDGVTPWPEELPDNVENYITLWARCRDGTVPKFGQVFEL